MSKKEDVAAAFSFRFGKAPQWICRAPGRVNIIGEHTDYNGGFVLPMAINHSVWIALRPRFDKEVRVYSLDFGESISFSLSNPKRSGPSWSEYIKAVAWSLIQGGLQLKGWDGVIGGDVPIGAGLSSSAALEMAAARAFAIAAELDWNPVEMAKICQRAENEWVGVSCGIMDQVISALAREGHALLLDCRSLDYRYVPIPSMVSVIILDTVTRRGLMDSAYNERRRQCEEAAKFFHADSLRDVKLEDFYSLADKLDPDVRKRARHVLTENQRVLQAVEALQNDEEQLLGQLMNESHQSLRDDFEVTNRELDLIVDIAQKQDGCNGARMTGAGFGGCAVAIVNPKKVLSFIERVKNEYKAATDLDPRIYLCTAVNGAEVNPA